MGKQDVRQGIAAPLEVARVAALAADDKKATDILALDLSGLSNVCDYFLICTAQNGPRWMPSLMASGRRSRKL